MTKIAASHLASLALLALAGTTAARANPFGFQVDLDTSGLASTPNAPFYLDFQLNQGQSSNPANTVTIDGFQFTGGSASGLATDYGLASGSISNSVLLSDSSASPYNELYQAITAGVTNISFDVFATQNSAGLTPDEFSFDVLDSESGLPQLPTTAPDGFSLLTLNLGPDNVLGNVNGYSTIAPGIAVAAIATPDSGRSLVLLAFAGAALCAMRRLFPQRA